MVGPATSAYAVRVADSHAVAEVCGLDDRLAAAYQLKEAFRASMDIAKTGDAELFEICLEIFDTWCRASKLAAFVTLANSMRSWRAEIVNYARTGAASNAFAASSGRPGWGSHPRS